MSKGRPSTLLGTTAPPPRSALRRATPTRLRSSSSLAVAPKRFARRRKRSEGGKGCATCQVRDPGLTAGNPCAHNGHSSRSYVGRSMCSSAVNGTPRSDRPERAATPRSTIPAGPTTWAPAARATWMVSRVEPPVVITSSITSTRSAAPSMNPRLSVSAPSTRSANSARTPSARPTSWPMTMPPSAGERTAVGFSASVRAAMAAPSASACRGCCSTSAHCKYPELCSPEVSRKWPSSSAPDLRNRSRSSSLVIWSIRIQLPEPNSPSRRLLIRIGSAFSPMEPSAMQHHPVCRARTLAFFAAVLATSVSAFAQSGQLKLEGVIQAAAQAAAQQQPTEITRRLSIDEAVKLGLEQNLGIQIQRIDPQIQDIGVAQARSFWAPQLNTAFSRQSQSTAPRNQFAGAATSVDNGLFASNVGLQQTLPWGAAYSANWNNSRFTTNTVGNKFNPELDSRLNVQFTQPLLRNFSIDQIRQQVLNSKKVRELSDIQLDAV